MTFKPQRFRERSAVVEAVQLTADADWDAIAAWCGGEVHLKDNDNYRFVSLTDHTDAHEGDWIIRFPGVFVVECDEEFRSWGYEPVGPRVVSTAAELRGLGDEVERTGGSAVLIEEGGRVWVMYLQGDPNVWLEAATGDASCIFNVRQVTDDVGEAEYPDNITGFGPWRVIHEPEEA